MNLIYLFILIAAAIPAIWWKAYVFVILWEWFVVPAFGLPPLQLGHAAGLILMVTFLGYRNREKPEESTGVIAAKAIAASICMPLFALGIGWVYKAVFL